MMTDHLAEAARYAKRSREALAQRDGAIRAAVTAGASVRSVARAVGLSAPAIDRIVQREGATNTRW